MNKTTNNTDQRVDLNPIKHFVEGNRNVLRTEAMSGILAILFSSAFGILLSLLGLNKINGFVNKLSANTPGNKISASDLHQFLMTIGLLMLISIFVYPFINGMVNRVIVKGTRKESVTFSSLFPFVVGRYVLSLLVFFSFIALLAIFYFVVVAFLLISPMLGVLVLLLGIVFLIILILRLIYSFFIIVDNKKPSSVMETFRKSASLWKKSGSAVVVYIIVIGIAMSIISSIFMGPTKTVSKTTITTNNLKSTQTVIMTPNSSVAEEIIYGVVGGLTTFIFFAGLGNIYNEAKKNLSK